MLSEAAASFPSDVPASSFSELQEHVRAERLHLGVAPDHAKEWWTFGAESRGRSLALPFVYFPVILGIGIVVAAVVTGRYSWVIAIPFGLLGMFLGSPMNPLRVLAVVLGVGLVVGGWVADLSSLVVSGLVMLLLYVELAVYYGLGYRAFRRFVFHDAAGFTKYWSAGIVMLRDTRSGETFRHRD